MLPATVTTFPFGVRPISQMRRSFASRVLAVPSSCLPARPASSDFRIGTPVPSAATTDRTGPLRRLGDVIPFAFNHFRAERTRLAIKTGTTDRHARQLRNQPRAAATAHLRRCRHDHPLRTRGQRPALEPQPGVKRIEALAAPAATAVGPLNRRRTHTGGERLRALATVTLHLATTHRARRRLKFGSFASSNSL